MEEVRERGSKESTRNMIKSYSRKEAKQQTGRKGRFRVECKKRAGEKFYCGKTQMRKTERVNDRAEERLEGRKPFVY